MSAPINPPAPLRALPFLLLPFMATFAVATVGCGAGTAVYWGMNRQEGSVQSACDTGNYAYVVVGFLNVFGQGRTPQLTLGGHCDPQAAGGCAGLSPEIHHCQVLGIKVLLSLGSAFGNYGLADEADARAVAAYLWDAFLGGGSAAVARPLGDAVLDGVDLFIEGGSTTTHWDDLVRVLAGYSTAAKKVYLSASPSCRYPDYYMRDAIATGVLDFVWLWLYGDPSCSYREDDPGDLIRTWDRWARSVKAGKLFMGLRAASAPFVTGYIEPEKLRDQVLPAIKTYANYGGIMLWNRYMDALSGYSELVKPYINMTCAVPMRVQSV